ncbi:MAG: DUF72 domain-containing protein [Abitibacteriaceae bacterium]|nr:DUF72 domain-containing protein [Abditibacteriaceae bacterium]
MIPTTKVTPVYICCAGWSIPTEQTGEFPTEGSHLERYAARFRAVEINSSFYRPHRPQTYTRWAATVPEQFQFSVKVPKTITHELRLRRVTELLVAFLQETAALGSKLGPLLVQLPPSLALDSGVVSDFFTTLRQHFAGQVVCEPRHVSWFTTEADELLNDYQIARVAADPALMPQAAIPGGWQGLVYYRLHGSPRTYYSAYTPEFLDNLAASIQEFAARSVPVWCIFDNTAAGAATSNALTLLERLGHAPLT